MASKLLITQTNLPDIKPTDLDELMTLLGRYFQIRDDYMNLASQEVSVDFFSIRGSQLGK